MHPRSVSEMELYIESQPCGECGETSDASAFERTFTGSGDERRQFYRGPCPRCESAREFVFFAPFHWPTLPLFTFGGDGPSSILSADDFRAAADRYMERAPDDPTPLHFSEFFPATRSLKWARAALDEVDKIHGGGDTAAARAALDSRVAKYDALKHAKADERRAGGAIEGPAPREPRGIDPKALRAHAEYAKRDRSGPGRLVLEGVQIHGGRYANTDLRGAGLVKCSLDKSDFTFSQLDHAELDACTAVGAAFANSGMRNASLTGCDFTSAGLQLVNLDDATIDGGVFRDMNCDRSMWLRTRVDRVDFRNAVFTDAVLEGVVFTDCDFRGADLGRVKTVLQRMASTLNTVFRRCDLRGAKIGGRRLDLTTFDTCKMHDIEGAPSIEGRYEIIDPDLSPMGDGADIRGAKAIYDMWGASPE